MIILVIIMSYLIGAIPFGFILGKIKGADLTEYGSGKIGFANTARTMGIKLGLVVFATDRAKGVAVVLLAKLLLDSKAGEIGAALAAVAGHNWSVYIKFHGGRGVSTSVGALLAMVPLAGGIGLGAFALAVVLSRYISLGSILGGVSALAAMIVLSALDRASTEYLVYTIIAVSLIMFQHRENILNLLAGTERKVGQAAQKRRIET